MNTNRYPELKYGQSEMAIVRYANRSADKCFYYFLENTENSLTIMPKSVELRTTS